MKKLEDGGEVEEEELFNNLHNPLEPGARAEIINFINLQINRGIYLSFIYLLVVLC